MDIVSDRPGSPWLRSPITLLALVVTCAAVLWFKLDSISQNLARHQHPPQDGTAGDGLGSGKGHSHGRRGTHSHDNAGLSTTAGELSAAHQHGPFHAATHAPEGKLQLVPEWAPTSAVALALPESHTKNADYLRLLGDLAEACLERANVNVIVLLEQNDVAARAACDKFIDGRSLDRSRIQFLEAKSLDTVWIRDYGPIFVRRREDRELFVVDTAYRDVRLILEEGGAAMLGMSAALRAADDLAPIYFSTLLNKPFVHPGFALNGGDLYADGQGVAYTSEETLHLNTGDREYVSGAFREYFGVGDIRFLRSLPGPTVKHIDMFFKLVSPGACLVGQYGPADEEDPELSSLQNAAGRLLDDNAEMLASHGLKVQRMPMPAITRLSRWDFFGLVLGNAERELRVAVMAKDEELPADKIQAKLQSKFVYTYRTYLNSVLLASGSGSAERSAKRVLIAPRYPTGNASQMESLVVEGYRAAYGDDLEVAFVDAESLAHANGSLRCVMCAIPAD